MATLQIRDRIVELRRVRARDLLPNRKNWRRHPKAQMAALKGMLSEVGYAGALLAYETPEGLQLIDGHARAQLTPDMEVPVLVTDLTPAEADKVLATLDPLSAMAQPDMDALTALLQDVSIGDAAVNAMLEALTAGENGPMPDFYDTPEADVTGITVARGVQGYNFELDPGKLGWRLEAAAKANKGRALELFAGKGVLSYWYRRAFSLLTTVDARSYPGIEHSMPSEDYLAYLFNPDEPYDFVDFDDEGCPSEALQIFFTAITGKQWPPFVVAFTDGMGLRLKRRPIENLFARYRWGDDNDVHSTREVYLLWPSLVEHHITVIAADAGYQAERINLARGSNNNVVYAAYTVSPTRSGGAR